MFIRKILSILLVAFAFAPATRAQRAEGEQPRNIIFILTDDQRYDALGAVGGDFWKTPHLDSLAEDGILFEYAFVTTSLCSPSRASILSGQYAHRHGVLNNSTRMPAETPTFPKELQKAGYETAFVGKWHMGGTSNEPRPGFDRWVSFRGQGPYYDPTFNIDGKEVKEKGNTTDLITDHAIEFLEQDRDKPYLLYVSHKAVHAMFEPSERHRGKYADVPYTYPDSMANTDENYEGKPAWVRAQRNSWHGVDGMYNGQIDFDEFIQGYAETLLGVDEGVGRILDTLKKKGELDSTLVVFTSDNGFMFGEHGHIDKRSMYEESIRVPLIARCPELFEGGQKKKEMILNIDFAPTFLEAAGAPVPDSIQGRSFYDVLTGEEENWRDAFLYEYFWERSFPQTPTVLGVRTDDHKLMRFHGVWDQYELYNIQDDPLEMNNLLGGLRLKNEAGTLDNVIKRQADPDLKELFMGLSGKLDALIEEVGAEKEPNWFPKEQR